MTTFIIRLHKFFYDFLIDSEISLFYAAILNLIVVSLIIFSIISILNYISTNVISKFFKKLSERTQNNLDDFLIQNKTHKYISKLVPVVFVYIVLPYWLFSYEFTIVYAYLIVETYLVFLVISIIISVLRALKSYLKTLENFKDKPLESFFQVITIALWFIGILNVFSIWTGNEITTFLAAMGALSAVILLIFKDTILGLVASIQLTSNDLIRIGDWITMKQYGADGDVVEINLNSVKVQNFDKTITTIPTYKLIADSFKNWRGMSESDGRRIKRSFSVKGSSVKFLSKDDLYQLKKIELIKDYIEKKEIELQKCNNENGSDLSVLVNGRNLTNLGLFRNYIEIYLDHAKNINSNMTVMCRQLSPTPTGIPLEIYAFSKNKEWKNYEHIMSDIFDHLLASLSNFQLDLFEYPTSLK